MDDDFEKWFGNLCKSGFYVNHYDVKQGFYMATEAMQSKLDTKDKELEALRRFAMHAYICVTAVGDMPTIESFKHFGLIDESGSPTPLLTGDK